MSVLYKKQCLKYFLAKYFLVNVNQTTKPHSNYDMQTTKKKKHLTSKDTKPYTEYWKLQSKNETPNIT